MKRQVADRLFLAGLCILAVCVSFFEPTSTSYIVMHAGGWAARVCMGTLLLLSLVALADTVVNDMLPEPYVFRTGWRFRQGVWMLIAITFTGMAFVSIRFDTGHWLALVDVLYGLRCAGVSFLDLYYEHVDGIRVRRSTDYGAL